LEFVNPADKDVFKPGDRLKMTGLHDALKNGTNIMVENLTQNKTIETKLDVSPRLREVLLAGGTLAYATAQGLS
jgi:aconitate hydratase